MSETLLLIDALNVIRHNPPLALWEEDHPFAVVCTLFTDMCYEAMAPGEHWVIFFDGAGDPEIRRDNKSNKILEIFYALDRKADDLIADQARFAQLDGKRVVVASSDHEVQAEGESILDAYEFYERLTTRHAPTFVSLPERIKAADMLHALAGSGFLRPDFAANKTIRKDLQRIIDYYGETIESKANKAAGRIEALLREHSALLPDPDPQQEARRKIKSLLKA